MVGGRMRGIVYADEVGDSPSGRRAIALPPAPNRLDEEPAHSLLTVGPVHPTTRHVALWSSR